MYRIHYCCFFSSILIVFLCTAVANAASSRYYHRKYSDRNSASKNVSNSLTNSTIISKNSSNSLINSSVTSQNENSSEVKSEGNRKGNGLDNLLATTPHSGSPEGESVNRKNSEQVRPNSSSLHKQSNVSTSVSHRNASGIIKESHPSPKEAIDSQFKSSSEVLKINNNKYPEESGPTKSSDDNRDGKTDRIIKETETDRADSFHNHPRIKHSIQKTATKEQTGLHGIDIKEEKIGNIDVKEEVKHGNVAKQLSGQSVSRSVRHLQVTDDITNDVVSPRHHRPDIVSLKTTVTSQESDELEPMVLGLREELKNFQATHIRTRSVINEIQEKQDAQERDMVIFKNELSKLRQVQMEQREQIESLGALTSDLSWALADMKQAQAQSAADFVAFKQVQLGVADDLKEVKKEKNGLVKELSRLATEQNSVLGIVKSLNKVQGQHNDTLLVMEEVIMSNALELQTLHQNVANVRGELESVREDLTEDRQRLKDLEAEVQTQLKQYRSIKDNSSPKQKSNSTKDQKHKESKSTNSSEWPKLNSHKSSTLSARRDDYDIQLEIDPKYSPGPGDTQIAQARLAQPLQGLHNQQTLADFGIFKSTIHAKLEVQAAELVSLRELSANLTENLGALNSSIQTLNRRHLIGSQLLNLQQSVVNLTKKVIDEQAAVGNAREIMNVNTVNSTEAHFGQVPLDYNNVLGKLQQSSAQISEELRQHETQSAMILRDVEERVKDLGARVWKTEDQLRQWQLGSLNATLQQCRQANSELSTRNTMTEVQQQVGHLDVRVSQHSLQANKLEANLQRLEEQLSGKVKAMTTSDNQITLMTGLSTDLNVVKHELFNFIASLPTDCQSALGDDRIDSNIHPSQRGSRFNFDGIYLIRPSASNYSLRVHCVSRLLVPVKGLSSDQGGEERRETAGEGLERRVEPEGVWMVVQRRDTGREKFSRTWDEYKYGFGDVSGEFWLGNEHIHRLTSDQGTEGSRSSYRLRVEIWDVLGRFWVAEYSSVKVESEANLYRLDLGHYSSGNASDALRYSNLMPFSTVDRDNDISTTHCAQFYESGWWYKHCHYSNLNGRYTSGIVWYHETMDEWLQLNRTTMMISRAEDNYANNYPPPLTIRPDGQS